MVAVSITGRLIGDFCGTTQWSWGLSPADPRKFESKLNNCLESAISQKIFTIANRKQWKSLCACFERSSLAGRRIQSHQSSLTKKRCKLTIGNRTHDWASRGLLVPNCCFTRLKGHLGAPIKMTNAPQRRRTTCGSENIFGCLMSNSGKNCRRRPHSHLISSRDDELGFVLR